MTKITDKSVPKLTLSTPKASSKEVNVAQNIVLTFDEAIKSGTGHITISNGSDTRTISITDKLQIKILGKTLTINPKTDLQSDSYYTVQIPSGVVKDISGNKYGGTKFNFDTVDTIQPILEKVSPENQSIGVAVGKNIVLTFSEKIKADSGNLILDNGQGDVRNIPITDKQVKISGKTVTFNPSKDLLPNSHYTVNIPNATLKDLAGNSFAGNSFAFDTIDTLKPLLEIKPEALALKENIILTFNETIKVGVGKITLTNGSDTRSISVTDKSQVTIDGKTIIINPTNDLKADSQYSVKITTGAVKDLAGNKFAGIQTATNFVFKTPADVLLKGKAVDGYLKGAEVFADENGDGIWNEGEAKTVTNEKGDFVLANAKGTIIASGGTDLTTGKEFKGVLKAPEGSTTVTPLTTIQQGFVDNGQTVAEAQKSVAKAFGIDETVDFTTYDPIKELASDSGDNVLAAKVMAATAKVANFLVTASATLQGAAGGENVLSTQNASESLIKSLVSNIEKSAETGNGTVNLADAKLLKTVLTESVTATGNVVLDKANATKIQNISDGFAKVMADAAKNIDDVVKNVDAADGLNLLSNIGKVSTFTQGTISTNLATAADTGKKLSTTLTNQLTGSSADKAIDKIVVELPAFIELVAAKDDAMVLVVPVVPVEPPVVPVVPVAPPVVPVVPVEPPVVPVVPVEPPVVPVVPVAPPVVPVVPVEPPVVPVVPVAPPVVPVVPVAPPVVPVVPVEPPVVPVVPVEPPVVPVVPVAPPVVPVVPVEPPVVPVVPVEPPVVPVVPVAPPVVPVVPVEPPVVPVVPVAPPVVPVVPVEPPVVPVVPVEPPVVPVVPVAPPVVPVVPVEPPVVPVVPVEPPVVSVVPVAPPVVPVVPVEPPVVPVVPVDNAEVEQKRLDDSAKQKAIDDANAEAKAVADKAIADNLAISSTHATHLSTTTPSADVFTIAIGTYSHSISGFANGDTLKFFTGAILNVVTDSNDNDGTQSITATNVVTGATTTITFTGLSVAQDTGLFNIPSFDTVFGAGSIL